MRFHLLCWFLSIGTTVVQEKHLIIIQIACETRGVKPLLLENKADENVYPEERIKRGKKQKRMFGK